MRDELAARSDMGVAQPVVRREHQVTLPFGELSPDNFELLCFLLLLHEDPQADVYYYGKTRDLGRDLVHRAGGTTTLIQVKRYAANLDAGDIREELAKLCVNIFRGAIPESPDVVAFYVSSDFTAPALAYLDEPSRWRTDAERALQKFLREKPPADLLAFARSWWPRFDRINGARLSVRIGAVPAVRDEFFSARKVIDALALPSALAPISADTAATRNEVALLRSELEWLRCAITKLAEQTGVGLPPPRAARIIDRPPSPDDAELFAQVVIGLGAAKAVVREDSAPIPSQPSGVRAPHLRVVAHSGEVIFVEVGRCGTSPFDGPWTTSAADRSALHQHARLFRGQLFYAVYWDALSMWTLVRSRHMKVERETATLDFSAALLRNEMELVGEVGIHAVGPLRMLVMPQERTCRPDSSGAVQFTIAEVQLEAAGTRVIRADERKLAWHLMLFGRWPLQGPHAIVDDGGHLTAVEHRFEPELPDDHPLAEGATAFIAMLSDLITRKVTHLWSLPGGRPLTADDLDVGFDPEREYDALRLARVTQVVDGTRRMRDIERRRTQKT